MTTDPPETRTKWSDMIAAERARYADPAFAERAWKRLVAEHPEAEHTVLGQPPPKPERDPSNLNDPKLQRLVVASAWLLVLVMLGTCVAGGACLLGAFRDCECEAAR